MLNRGQLLTGILFRIEKADFINALQYVKIDKWEAAITLWKKYTYGKNKRLAANACYNMAIASETYDNIDVALEWAAKSFLLKKDEFTEKYI